MVKYEEIKDILSNNDKKAVNRFVEKMNNDIEKTNKSIQIGYNRLMKDGENDDLKFQITNSIGYLEFLKQWLVTVENHKFELENDIEEYDLYDIKKQLDLK